MRKEFIAFMLKIKNIEENPTAHSRVEEIKKLELCIWNLMKYKVDQNAEEIISAFSAIQMLSQETLLNNLMKNVLLQEGSLQFWNDFVAQINVSLPILTSNIALETKKNFINLKFNKIFGEINVEGVSFEKLKQSIELSINALKAELNKSKPHANASLFPTNHEENGGYQISNGNWYSGARPAEIVAIPVNIFEEGFYQKYPKLSTATKAFIQEQLALINEGKLPTKKIHFGNLGLGDEYIISDIGSGFSDPSEVLRQKVKKALSYVLGEKLSHNKMSSSEAAQFLRDFLKDGKLFKENMEYRSVVSTHKLIDNVIDFYKEVNAFPKEKHYKFGW